MFALFSTEKKCHTHSFDIITKNRQESRGQRFSIRTSFALALLRGDNRYNIIRIRSINGELRCVCDRLLIVQQLLRRGATRPRATRVYRLLRSEEKQVKVTDHRQRKPKQSPQNTTPPECSSIPYFPPPPPPRKSNV